MPCKGVTRSFAAGPSCTEEQSENRQAPPTIATMNNMTSKCIKTNQAITIIREHQHQQHRLARKHTALIVMNLLVALCIHSMHGDYHADSPTGINGFFRAVDAVSVQRLNVPDLVVIDQFNQHFNTSYGSGYQLSQSMGRNSGMQDSYMLHNGNGRSVSNSSAGNQPEAASLINNQDLALSELSQQQQAGMPMITFECLISFDRRKDKNLIVKWHHDDRIEPIYQWIPELNKRSIAPQYRAYIVPIVSNFNELPEPAIAQPLQGSQNPPDGVNINSALPATSFNPNQLKSNLAAQSNQTQLLEAGFRLVKPSKELGGKYTCSVISTQNDDSKWKKMIVFTPPRSFSFNASKADIALNRGNVGPSPTVRLQTTFGGPASMAANQQLPLAYRMKGLEASQSAQSHQSSNILAGQTNGLDGSQLQQRTRQTTSPWLTNPATMSPYFGTNSAPVNLQQVSTDQSGPAELPGGGFLGATNSRQQNSNVKLIQQSTMTSGVKLTCDIDQVFPVPEVSIYRLAKSDGSHPDKLSRLDTKIERDSQTGLYHVQVTKILEDDELQMKYGLSQPLHFECIIALTNLELSKYADNKRSIVYRPGLLTKSTLGLQLNEPGHNYDISSNSGNSINLVDKQNLMLRITTVWLISWFAIARQRWLFV